MKTITLWIALIPFWLFGQSNQTISGQIVSGNATGDGLVAAYFKGAISEKPIKTNLVRSINEYQPIGERLFAGLPSTNYSIRYDGFLKSPISGQVQLHFTADDGVRIWLEDRLIMDEWRGQPATHFTTTVTLLKDQFYRLRIEYFQYEWDGTQKLEWTYNGSRNVIPQSALYSKLPDAALDYDQLLSNPKTKEDDFFMTGDGLKVIYFKGQNFESPRFSGVDKSINQQFKIGENNPKLNSDKYYSAKWTGFIYAPVDGTYEIGFAADDGVNVSVDGDQAISKMYAQLANYWHKGYNWKAGTFHRVEIQYFQAEFDATHKLKWQVNNGPEMPISQGFLFTRIPEKEIEIEIESLPELADANEPIITTQQEIQANNSATTKAQATISETKDNPIVEEEVSTTLYPIAENQNSETINPLLSIDGQAKVYPNPSSGTVNIEYEGDDELTQVEIVNFNGQAVYAIPVPQNTLSFKQQISLRKLSRGNYLVNFITKNGVLSQKLILEF